MINIEDRGSDDGSADRRDSEERHVESLETDNDNYLDGMPYFSESGITKNIYILSSAGKVGSVILAHGFVYLNSHNLIIQ